MARIGIRREDKSRWEARVPLVPADVERLIRDHGLDVTVQTSPIRTFSDDAYRAVGAAVAEDLADCPIIMGVKEIPPARFETGKTYVFFSHVIKGQPANMPMLRRLMALGCQVIDYEKITDDQGRRLVFFGRFAGVAGMIDTLWALGERLKHEGVDNPFVRIRPAHRYDDLDHVRREIGAVSDSIRKDGLPDAIQPLVCGFAGYGQVSLGAQEIYDLLPVVEVSPEELPSVKPASRECHKIVFREEHMAERIDGSSPFELQEYYDYPDRYRASFFPQVPYLTMLVNCIYWEPKYPRLITRKQFQELYAEPGSTRLRIIGDITADLDGSLACTTRVTAPDKPIYVYDPATGQTPDGVAGNGPVILAVDFLPCEVPVDASIEFSRSLLPFMSRLAAADLSGSLAESGLPPELARAMIVYHGELTEPYGYIRDYLDE